MFELLGDILYQAGALHVEEAEKMELYRAKHTQAERRGKWSRAAVFIAKMVDNGEEFKCEWSNSTQMGLLCCHVQVRSMHL